MEIDRDQRRAAGESVGPLAGLPVAIKDGICTRDLRTTAGSRMLEDFVPNYHATVVQRLLDADAVVIGSALVSHMAQCDTLERVDDLVEQFLSPIRKSLNSMV